MSEICPICHGTRWTTIVQDGVSRATRCECWRQSASSRRLSEARIPRRYQHCDFDGFVTYGNEKLEQAVSWARRLVQRYPVTDKGLFLIGPPGVGKTHLSVAVLRALMVTKGARGVFYDTRELLRLVRSTYDPSLAESERDVLAPVMHADVLVLDDLGAEKSSEWVDETLNLIVNTRYSEKRLTLFTSNYVDDPDGPPESLLFRIGRRMRSRLHEMCEFIDLEGADYRELPANGGEEDLRILWRQRRKQPPSGGLPVKASAPMRATLRGKADLPAGLPELGWPGGRAGSRMR